MKLHTLVCTVLGSILLTCFGKAQPLTLSNNVTLVIAPGGSGTLTSNHLQAVSASSPPSQVVFTLVSSLPAVGHVKRSGEHVGWLLNPTTNHCYAITSPGSRTATAVEAGNLGGYLTSITSADENRWITSNFSRSSQAWIGLNDPGGWSHGEPVVFTNWYGGEPNSSSENFVNIYMSPDRVNGDGGTWNDLSNSDRAIIGIVEKDSSSGLRLSFTQEDIDLGRITYQHFGSHYGPPEEAPDDFTFTVADGQGNTIGNTVFNIVTTAAIPDIAVEQPAGAGLIDGTANVGFGTALLGSSIVKTFTIRNAGAGNLTGLTITTNGPNTPDFTVSAPGATVLAPNESTTFQATFTPSAAGSRSAAIHVASNDPDENPFDIDLTGTGSTPLTVVIQPGPVDGKDTFCSRGGSGTEGRANHNHGALLEMVVGQTGGSGQVERTLIQFDLSSLPSGAVVQTAVLKLKRLIARGGTLEAYRLKKPWVEGDFSASDGEASWQSRLPGVPWSVSGFRADDGAGYHLNDAEIDSPLFSQEISVDGANFASFPLNPAKVQEWISDSSTNFGFMMKLTSEGGTNSNVHFATSESPSAADRPSLTITYLVAAAPEIVVEQPSGTSLIDNTANINFGSIPIGNSSGSVPFTITNTGTDTLTGLAITKDGTHETNFIVGTLGATTLAPGASTTFSVQFSPSGSAGTKTAALHIASNDADENPFDITLTGTAQAAPVPSSISFGASVYSVHQGATAAPITLNRTNGTLAASVTINTDNGTASTIPPFSAAVAPTDYTDLTGPATTVDFAIGELTKTVPVTLIPKTPANTPNKRFTATISNPAGGAVLGPITTTTIHILANDTTNPTLTVTAPPATAATLSAPLPYLVTGVAGDARGIDRVEVVVNGAPPIHAVMGAATSNTSRPYSLNVNLMAGSNTLAVTAYDLRGNNITVTRNFDFTRRYVLSLSRTAPTGILLDTAGTVALAATPTTGAASLKPATANANPRTSDIVPGTVIKLTATPKTGYVLSHWSGIPTGGTALNNVLTFSMPAADVSGVTAHFVVNPFLAPAGASGSFYGLIAPVSGTPTSNATVGFITGALTATSGAFTGKVLIDGLSQSFAATFSGNGSALFTVGTIKEPALNFSGKTLTLTFTDGNVMATIVSVAGTSIGTAVRAAYSTTNKVPAALLNSATQGFFTLSFPSKAQSPAISASAYPQGSGFATLTLTNAGVVTLAGTLADGTTLTASSALVPGIGCPLFAQLPTPGAAASIKGGSLGGTLNFNLASADSDVTGTNLLWIRPAVSQVAGTAAAALATQLYTAGWPSGITVDAFGALYNKTTNVQTTLGLGPVNPVTGNAKLAFTDGKLTAAVIKSKFNINANTVTKIPTNDPTYTLALSPTGGTFNGAFTPNWTPLATAKPAFKGILIQKGASKGGYGYFLSNAAGDLDPESGGVTLGAP